MIEIYGITSIIFAYIIMTDLENLRHTPVKTDLKLRNKTNAKIKELEKELNLFLLWPWLLVKKIKNEYSVRKQN
jgi:hypothetical protein